MKTNKGFTLLETIVVSLIAGIVGLGTINAIAMSNRLVNETNLHTMTNTSVHNIMLALSNDVREGVAMSTDGETLIIHNADGTQRKWASDGQGAMMRSSQSGTGYYRMFGRRKGEDSKLIAKFKVNTDHFGNVFPMKYHKVDVELLYKTSTGYENESVSATYYTKHVASFYGY